MAAASPPRGYRAPASASASSRSGKEFLTGEFPSRLPELRRELQIERRQDALAARRTGLFDFRLGADIHVLVGCGLGGGSLINAGVALRPDARVFADPAWPERGARRRIA